MDYLVYQLEKAPTTGQLHLQGYVAFKKRTTLKTAGSAISTHAHFTSARGTPAQNKAYCTKADRLQGPWEFGSLPAGHGHRSDLDSACKAIASGASASSLATTAPTTYVHYHRGLKALEFELRPSLNGVRLSAMYSGARLALARLGLPSSLPLLASPPPTL